MTWIQECNISSDTIFSVASRSGNISLKNREVPTRMTYIKGVLGEILFGVARLSKNPPYTGESLLVELFTGDHELLPYQPVMSLQSSLNKYLNLLFCVAQ